MKNPSLTLALSLVLGATGAQAASWTLGTGTVSGLRVGAVSFDGLPAGVEIGNLTDDLDETGLDYLAAGSWRSLTASLGGNTIDLHLGHEAYAEAGQALAPATAALRVNTQVSLDMAQIGTATTLSLVGLAPARVMQDFVIAPDLGESTGMPVFVTFSAYYDQAANDAGFDPYLSSSYRLYLNGSLLESDVQTGAGAGGGTGLTFAALIGDTLSLDLINTTQLGVAGMALLAGDKAEAWAYGEAGAALTLSPIPEPETWAMLLAGLGLVGLMARRRQT